MKRVGSALIDYILFGLVWASYLRLFGTYHEDNFGNWSYTVDGIGSLPLFIFWLGWFPILESTLGYTIGKGLLDMRVVKDDGKPVSFGKSLLRHFFDAFDIMAFVILVIVPILKPKRFQRIGDLVASTFVIAENEQLIEEIKETNADVV